MLNRVPKNLLVYPLPAAVLVATWLRLEEPHEPAAALALAVLAFVPALVRSARGRLVASAVALVAAAWIAFGALPLRHPGRIAADFGNGVLDFYDVPVPFDPRVHAEMRGAILLAVFSFSLALSLTVSARRTLPAVVVILVGAGWPATLVAGGNELARGAIILIAVFTLLAGLAPRRLPRAALPAALVLALVAAAASTSSAVAKHELVGWQGWDFYTRPDAPVDVGFVWTSQYEGIRFPKKRTVVLRVDAPPLSTYWRATTLDQYAAGRWVEGPSPGNVSLAGPDPLLPPAARRRSQLVREEVTVAALRDAHLVGGSTPVYFSAGSAPLVYPHRGVALVAGGLTRGLRYTVWSYAPQPSAPKLARSAPLYPRALEPYLEIEPNTRVPHFGTPGRWRVVDNLLVGRQELQPYEPLARVAREVAGKARSPYAAAVSLESWLRLQGGFRYEERPPVTASVPPLVGFVVQTRAGYCQYFAGAMALMLRYLGIPARVAVGFTSGTYRGGTWTVTDHDAHAWVEVWFRGYGWLPFDPTPGRGRLSAPYSAGSPTFLRGVSSVLARALGLRDTADIALDGSFREPGGFASTNRGAPAAPAADGSGRSSRSGSLLALLGLLAGATLAAIVLAKAVARRVRYVTRDPRRLATAARRELADYLLDQHIDAARSATLHELGRLTRDELAVDPDLFVAAATAARFGPPENAAGAAQRARRELRALKRRLRSRLGAGERLRGLLSLRSLGVSG